MYKYLQEIANKKGKLLLIENCSLSLQSIERIDIPKEKCLTESKTNQKYEAIAILEGVDITKFTPNFNKRLYPKKLWQQVEQKKWAEGTNCYANHSDEDKEPNLLRLVGIWHNFRINEKTQTGKADLYLIGENGKLLLDSIQAGSKKNGVSTVAFGAYEEREEELQQYKDLDDDVEVIDWENFEFEGADWVAQPSADVYFKQENIVTDDKSNDPKIEEQTKLLKNNQNLNKNDIKESIKDNILLENIYTNNIDEKKESKMADNLNLTAFKQSTRKSIKEAINNTNHKEGLEELFQLREDIRESLGDTEGKSLYNVIDKGIETKIMSMANIISKLTEANNILGNQLDVASQSMDDMKKKYEEMEKIVKKFKEDEEVKPEDEKKDEITEEDELKKPENQDVPDENKISEDEIVDEKKPDDKKEEPKVEGCDGTGKGKGKVKEQEIAPEKKEEPKVDDKKDEVKEDEEVKPEDEKKDEITEEDELKKPENQDVPDENKIVEDEEIKPEDEKKDGELIAESDLCKKYNLKSLDEVEEIKIKKAEVKNGPVARYFKIKEQLNPELKEIREEVLKAKTIVEARKIINLFLEDEEVKPEDEKKPEDKKEEDEEGNIFVDADKEDEKDDKKDEVKEDEEVKDDEEKDEVQVTQITESRERKSNWIPKGWK